MRASSGRLGRQDREPTLPIWSPGFGKTQGCQSAIRRRIASERGAEWGEKPTRSAREGCDSSRAGTLDRTYPPVLSRQKVAGPLRSGLPLSGGFAACSCGARRTSDQQSRTCMASVALSTSRDDPIPERRR
jgi:hypothetical protein